MEAILQDMLADLILGFVASLLVAFILDWLTPLSFRQSFGCVLIAVLILCVAAALLKAKSSETRTRIADEPTPTPPPTPSPPPPVLQGTLDSFIGSLRTAPEVAHFLDTLGKPERCIAETNCLSFPQKGLEIVFDANNTLAKFVAFSDRVAGYGSYLGPPPLPQGLSIDLTQEEVHEMLHDLHQQACGARWCKYKLPQYLIDLEYEDGEILRISIVRPEFHPTEQISSTGG